MTPAGNGNGNEPAVEQVAERQRKTQQEIDQIDLRKIGKPASSEESGAVQAGARHQPELPMPEQHLAKPGLESDLNPRPQCEAPDYKGSGPGG